MPVDYLLSHAEQFGAVLVFAGLVFSMFFGSPASRVSDGVSSIVGDADERQIALHSTLIPKIA